MAHGRSASSSSIIGGGGSKSRRPRSLSSSSSSSSSSFWGALGLTPDVILLGLALAVIYQYLATHRPQVEAALGGGRRARYYSDFGAFYEGLYKKEHASTFNLYLHFVGTSLAIWQLLADPRLLVAGLMSIAVGLNLFELTYRVPHGLIEFVVMGIVFVQLSARLTGSYRKPWAVMCTGYMFAWAGHFLVERNRPATFTYAVFSLVADFKMWFETARELASQLTALVG